jgi:hypothetical protein
MKRILGLILAAAFAVAACNTSPGGSSVETLPPLESASPAASGSPLASEMPSESPSELPSEMPSGSP